MPSFNHRQVSHGDLCLLGECFLRETALAPKLADRGSKGWLWLGGTSHSCTLSNAGEMVYLKFQL